MVLVSACGSNPATPLPPDTSGPTPPAPGQPQPPAAIPASYRVSGVVSDESGSPIAGASVEVRSSALRLTTRTDGGGAYAIENVPSGVGLAGAVGVFALVTASAPDHWENVQLLATVTNPELTRNLRLRRMRRISTGESIVLTMDAYSSLLGEYATEDFDGAPTTALGLTTIQERFIIDNHEAGRLFIQADHGDDGSGYPYIHVCRVQLSGCQPHFDFAQRSLSLNIGGGERFEVSIRVPPRPDSPRRYTIRTFRTP